MHSEDPSWRFRFGLPPLLAQISVRQARIRKKSIKTSMNRNVPADPDNPGPNERKLTREEEAQIMLLQATRPTRIALLMTPPDFPSKLTMSHGVEYGNVI